MRNTLRRTAIFTSSLVFLIAVALAGPASAQTVNLSAEAPKAEATPAAPAPTPAAVTEAEDAGATNPKPDDAPTAAPPSKAEADPPKESPSPAPTNPPTQAPACERTIKADVVAIAQPIMLNRLGASIPGGLMYALSKDVDGNRLRAGKRARPLVLRANVGDCLQITFTNNIPTSALPGTRDVSMHIQGVEWVEGSKDDGSYVGANNTSLASPSPNPSPAPPLSHTRTYSLYAKAEGTYLLYTMGDTSTEGNQLLLGLFGSLNVQPRTAEWYRSQVTADDVALATYNANSLGSNTLTPNNCTNNCTLTIQGPTPRQVKVKRTPGGYLYTPDNHPLLNYDAVYPATRADGTPVPPKLVGTPILKMLDQNSNIVHSDLTAIITGPNAGRFAGTTGVNNPEPPCNAEANPLLQTGPDPLFCANPASPDRKQPYREITIIYHGGLGQIATQAFPIFSAPNPQPNDVNSPAGAATLAAGKDAFAINYGTGGIGAEIYANRIGVGPMGPCVDCKYEEFFLSAWSVGDPAMLVDVPANASLQPAPPPAPPQPSQLWIARRTGTVKFTNNSATATGVGTKFKTELAAGNQLVLESSTGTIRGTVKSITNDTTLVLTTNATASATGVYGATVPGKPPEAASGAAPTPWLCSSPQLGDRSVANPPANPTAIAPDPNCVGARQPASGSPYSITPLPKATRAYYPDDPSNVYHSYINDHVKFRILHGGVDVSHVHHQHAHQWLQSPNSDESSYLDSQMISPGATYTLEMTYNGSGNRNKVVGDSIFHCHFYPHFAAGMWAMWRTHDTFESGTYVFPDGRVVPGARALPDGEIKAGTPNPAIVPMPTLPMAPLPAYAQIRNNVQVNGAPVSFGGQVVVGGTCQGNAVNGLAVVDGNGNPATCTNGQHVNGTVINSQFNGTTMTGQFQLSQNNRIENPGYPYFIPGIAGARAPHPPFDFAPDTAGGFLDGGLPRHVVTGGTVAYERHTQFDWSKDLGTMVAFGLPEDGTEVEKAAISFFSKRCYETSLPDGTPGNCPSPASVDPQSTLNQPPTGFLLNGLPRGPQPGAPFADPGIDDNGKAVGLKRTYKAAAIQLDVTFNKRGWHFPQQRILTLWQDVMPSYNYKPGGTTGRQPEPLFFRANSGDIIEYWHTNLVPNYYLVDDFQVRTPTDIIGQHIHLVKFDVTSSDGAANGFNYEDGTYSPQEVQEMVTAINATGGMTVGGSKQLLALKPPPKEIVDCAANPSDPRCKCAARDPQGRCIQACDEHPTPTSRPTCTSWYGSQTTIQRWYVDPLLDNSKVDRTMRTVFTHDHFGPSTHQQAGLYAGLLIEPLGSTWRNSEDGTVMGRPADQPPVRADGGPTSWKADILTIDKDNNNISYREFALEFQDFQLAYQTSYPGATRPPITKPSDDPSQGWRDRPFAILPPSSPQLISTAINPTPGTHSVNYLNEPLPWRVGNSADLSYAYDNLIQKTLNPQDKPDPMTPLLRAYENDNVQVRLLVGAHTFSHQFNLMGPTWFAEPSWKNSGYRSAQPMGLSEHFELLFHVPPSSMPSSNRKCPDGMSPRNCVDYLYSPSLDEIGLANGMWGLFRAYDPSQPANKLQYLPNNTAAMNSNVSYSTCPANLAPPAVRRVFNITAVTAQKALSLISPVPGVNPPIGQIVFNKRAGTLHSSIGVMYVRTEDLDTQGRLKVGSPVEPLVLRANAGDCIEVNLTNAVATTAEVFKKQFLFAPPFNGVVPGTGKPAYQSQMSANVGLHPQLLGFDAAQSTGMNIGWNRDYPAQRDQVVGFNKTVKYQWYAGKIGRDAAGQLTYTPVEFGALNLFPSDPVFQNINGLFGSMIIEPAGTQSMKCGEAGSPADCWKCDDMAAPSQAACYASGPVPPSRTSATINYSVTEGGVPVQKSFREFALMISDSIVISKSTVDAPLNTSAVNYGTEPQNFRYKGFTTQDFSCMLSNQLRNVNGDPQTPILTAAIGDAVRFRMTHPFGTGTSQVFTVHGHAWQRNPYLGESKTLGNQPLSQWMGSRDNHGSSDHFDMLIDKAGGEFGRGGDYLYTVFVPNQAIKGAWGLFRVGPPGVPGLPTPACGQPVPYPTTAPRKDPRELERFIRQPIQQENQKVNP